jgi:hypothetical protein
MFTGNTLGVVGGRLCPWSYGLTLLSGLECSESILDTPSRMPDDQPSSDDISHQQVGLTFIQRDQTPTLFPHHDTFGNPPTTNCCECLRPLGFCRPPFQSRRRSWSPSSPGPTQVRRALLTRGISSASWRTQTPSLVT